MKKIIVSLSFIAALFTSTTLLAMQEEEKGILCKLTTRPDSPQEVEDAIFSLLNQGDIGTVVGLSKRYLAKMPDLWKMIPLDLSNRSIDEPLIAKFISCTSLTDLNLGFPEKSWLGCGPKISNLTNLQRLNLMCHYENTADRKTGSYINNLNLTSLKYLTDLSIGGNSLKRNVEYFAGFTKLQRLNVGCNCLGQEIRHLSVLTNLTELDVALDDGGIDPHMWTLQPLQKLRRLNVAHNMFFPRESTNSGESANYFAFFTNLTDLNMSDCAAGPSLSRITSLINLTSLNCAQNNIGENGRYLSTLTNLTSLNCAKNNIGEFAQYCSTLTNLTYFDCSGSELSESPKYFSMLSNLTNLSYGDMQEPYMERNSTIFIYGVPVEDLKEYSTHLPNLTRLNGHTTDSFIRTFNFRR